MAITLADAKVGMADHVDQQVVDEFRRGSLLLDKLTFDNSVSPGTGGSTMIYGYQQLQTPSTAAFRAINTEYTPNEAKRVEKTAKLKIFGGSASIDRVIQATSGKVNELNFQLKQKTIAAKNLFHYTVINGDATQNENEFDGLDIMLTGKSTENTEHIGFDLSDSDKIDTNYKRFMDIMDEFLSGIEGGADLIMGNTKMISKLSGIARRMGYLTHAEDAFGRKINAYGDIPLMDLGEYFNGTKGDPVVPIYEATPETTKFTGLTDLYVVKFDLDAFHAVSPVGDKLIKAYLPDFNAPGAVKNADVEMVAAVALKNTLKAGVLRGIKVQ